MPMAQPSHSSRDDSSLDSLLSQYCRLPDPLVSYEDAERRAHRDLNGLSLGAIRQERRILRFWLSFQRKAHPWYFERVKRLGERINHVS